MYLVFFSYYLLSFPPIQVNNGNKARLFFDFAGIPEEIAMIKGSCLCGSVEFEIEKAVGPFELCHCSRCRKVSGSAFVSGLGVRTEDFRLIQGRELIQTYEAPIIENPPAYKTCFCTRCGSPVPDPDPESDWFEIPAGLLDGDPGRHPDKHIFIEDKSEWFIIIDDLPQFTKDNLIALRAQAKSTT